VPCRRFVCLELICAVLSNDYMSVTAFLQNVNRRVPADRHLETAAPWASPPALRRTGSGFPGKQVYLQIKEVCTTGSRREKTCGL